MKMRIKWVVLAVVCAFCFLSLNIFVSVANAQDEKNVHDWTTVTQKDWPAGATEYNMVPDVLSSLNQDFSNSRTQEGYQFNLYTPRLASGGHTLVGCAPTAMTAIENYHQKPSGYNLTHGVIGDPYNYLVRLMADQGKVSEWFPSVKSGSPNTDYGENCTNFWAPMVPKVLNAFGYDSDIKYYSINDGLTDIQRLDSFYTLVKREVDNGRPLFMGLRHTFTEGDADHGIVITGYKRVDGQRFVYCLLGWGIEVSDSTQGSYNHWWNIDDTHLETKGMLWWKKVYNANYDFNNWSVVTIKPLPENSDTGFADLNKNHWGYKYIHDLGNNLSGHTLQGQRYFLPDAGLIRSDAVAMILKGLKIGDWATATGEKYNTYVNKAKKFEDLQNGADPKMLAYIGNAITLNVIAEYNYFSNNKFRPQDGITRGDFAIWLITAIVQKETNYNPGPFDTWDSVWKSKTNKFKYPIDEYGHYSLEDLALIMLYNSGIISGYKDGDLGTYNPITRAEAAKIIVNTRNIWGIK
jgi:hypothetical protein